MISHRAELLSRLDDVVAGLIKRQITDAGDPRYGGF